MVLLHTCAGVSENQHQWADWFRIRSYAALVVDSFSATHQMSVCGFGKNPSQAEVAGDALGALAYLRSLSFIDGQRIGVIGWSYGATAILLLTNPKTIAVPPSGGFRAAVTMYATCWGGFDGYVRVDPAIPLLLLFGNRDDEAKSERCVEQASKLAQDGRPVIWHEYQGVYHEFDDPGLKTGKNG